MEIAVGQSLQAATLLTEIAPRSILTCAKVIPAT
jgi:hypothetical protein